MQFVVYDSVGAAATAAAVAAASVVVVAVAELILNSR